MLYLDCREGESEGEESRARRCVDGRSRKRRSNEGAERRARAIAVPRSSSSVMGCMIYVVDVAVVRPFSTAASIHVPPERGQ